MMRCNNCGKNPADFAIRAGVLRVLACAWCHVRGFYAGHTATLLPVKAPQKPKP